MTASLLLDEMFPHTLADTLRDKGHDVTAVLAMVELVGRDDATVLDAARAAGRCLVTENVRDFALLARYTRHAGILFVAARRWPKTRAALPRLANALHETVAAGRLPGPDDRRWLT
ncbi:hypothetical protein BLA60_28560 [Actinophytocola xinjiangensis]|uniref:DUF5615 domain-containing protein n=1 Tax=Actinophytocola xinjiangensis TaxID=485602 RepID=A0A7Z0WIF1_9PSEU|nr:DUF5615 family PIN-like protein [Actinophytocola xinjiangensis]OLF07166.1 hypothetical protein BLA60_28560 [Actinophytocola xinjiangensis]